MLGLAATFVSAVAGCKTAVAASLKTYSLSSSAATATVTATRVRIVVAGTCSFSLWV